MRYTVIKSEINLIGSGWYGQPIVATIDLQQSQIDDLRDDRGNITRDSVERWLCSHTGDFKDFSDFQADLSFDNKDILIEWKDPESEYIWSDTMFPFEDY